MRVTTDNGVMSNTTEHPRVFISYSWTSPEHEQFVLDLATTLRDNGVDAILDKWHLKPGQDKYVFMESMVTDKSVSRVLVLSDKKYSEKADARVGGVGTESQIISEKLYTETDQTKFIPVVCEYSDDGLPCLPVFMKARVYVDLSSEDKFGEGLEKLLRLIYEQPTHKMPALGGAPAFLRAESTGIVLTREHAAAVRAIQEGKPNRSGLEALFVRALVGRIDALYVSPTGDDYDEAIVQAIHQTQGLRDQLSAYVESVSAFSGDDPTSIAHVQRLLEQLGARFDYAGEGQHFPGWQDPYKFFALETMLLAVAALLRHSRWRTLRRLLDYRYVVSNDRTNKALPSCAFDSHMRSLDEHRNARLKLNRVSVTADMLRDRCSENSTSFSELKQADVFLALDAAVNLSTRTDGHGSYLNIWLPRTSVYLNSDPTELFLRAHNDDVRSGIRTAVGVQCGDELNSRLVSAATKLDDFRLLSPDRGFGRGRFIGALNLPVLVKN